MICEADREFFERELSSFVPNRVFDAHTHLSHPDFYQPELAGLPEIVGIEEHCRYIDVLHPGRQYGALVISFSYNADQIQKANEWTVCNIADRRNFRGLFLSKPDDDPEWVRQEVCRLGLHGLKCYHSFAPGHTTWNADIPEYLPERLVTTAHEEAWPIVLHIVKDRAVADPDNIHWIRHYCKTYPNMKLILAHSSRGFQPSHNLEGLPKLRGLDNLYFDTSTNCEPLAHIAIVRNFGHKKLMYGSDGLLSSHMRGRTVAVADSFLWLQENQPIWNTKYKDIQPVLYGLEHLRSLKWACYALKLSDSQVEDIFWNNAARLLRLQ